MHKECHSYFLILSLAINFSACSDSKEQGGGGAGKGYEFSADALTKISLNEDSAGLKALAASDSTKSYGLAEEGPTLCTSVLCFTPTVLTGKYFGTGFSIQSSGNGMAAYFGADAWSEIDGSSDTFSFDSAAPISNSDSLNCCVGTGDLMSENTYISGATYLFAYLDATFTVSGVTGNTSMNREFTVRFVFADDAIATAKRGDLLLKDSEDDTFKWMDTAASAGGNVGNGTLVATRPASPVMMDKDVSDWKNPYEKGNQEIPSIEAYVVTEKEGEVFQVNEEELKIEGRTYTYAFDPTNFIVFPARLKADINMINSYYDLLSNISLGGLPHSSQSMGVGNPAGTRLIIEEPAE